LLGEIEVVAGGVSEERVDEMEPAQVDVAAGEESHGGTCEFGFAGAGEGAGAEARGAI
jgi:hypothetical protein